MLTRTKAQIPNLNSNQHTSPCPISEQQDFSTTNALGGNSGFFNVHRPSSPLWRTIIVGAKGLCVSPRVHLIIRFFSKIQYLTVRFLFDRANNFLSPAARPNQYFDNKGLQPPYILQAKITNWRNVGPLTCHNLWLFCNTTACLALQIMICGLLVEKLPTRTNNY